MRIGISLSPGGLLLPYHIGVLDSLQYNGILQHDTHLAGSSAGAIAVVSHAAQVDSRRVLEATIDISDRCQELGGARGRLLPLLKEKMQEMICDQKFGNIQTRPGITGVAYRELFPMNKPVLQKDFSTRHDLIAAVCASSSFPFFASNWPCTLGTSRRIPRFLVDGWFAVPRNRAGCPDLAQAGVPVDRTITVSVFPKEMIGLTASDVRDCISPSIEDENTVWNLIQLATKPSSRRELTNAYESGWKDAEDWWHADQQQRTDANTATVAVA